MALENVYAAPDASLSPSEIIVPAEILKNIKGGWLAGIFSAAMTAVVTAVAMSGTKIGDFSAWNLVDVLLILALAFGIYKKSRICANTMLVYFFVGKIIQFTSTGQVQGLLMGVIFLVLYWRAAAATFAYHTYLRNEQG